MEQLSPQDAQFLYMEDADIVANVTACFICDQTKAPGGKVRFKDILQKIEERLDPSPVFRRKLVRVPFEADYPYWALDEHFDLEYHVHHARLPAPFDWRQLCIHMARYHSRPLDMARPLWEAYVVEGLDNVEGVPMGSFALFLKVHHSAVDGASAAQFMGSLMDLGPEGPQVMPIPERAPQQPGAEPSMVSMLTKASINNARSPIRLGGAILRSSPQLYRTFLKRRKTGFHSTGQVPYTRFNQAISPHRAFDATELPLEGFKNIRKAVTGAKINDVVIAVCGGALRAYLKDKEELPGDSLVATVPINVRPDSADADVSGGGNAISAMTVPIFSNIANPIERLKAVVNVTKRTKAAKDGLAARLMTDLSQHVPAATQAIASRLILQNEAVSSRISNVFISNIPGPQVPFYFCGSKVVSHYGMAPIAHGGGLFIATPSYDGKISFGITSTRDLIPDTPFFVECLVRSFEELKAAAAKRLEARARKAAPSKMSSTDAAKPKATKKKTTKRATTRRSVKSKAGQTVATANSSNGQAAEETGAEDAAVSASESSNSEIRLQNE